jgi:hypothetical protein
MNAVLDRREKVAVDATAVTHLEIWMRVRVHGGQNYPSKSMKLAKGSLLTSFTNPSLTVTLPAPGLLSSILSQHGVRRKIFRRFLCFSSPSSIFLSSDASAFMGRLLSIASFTSSALSTASLETPLIQINEPVL